MTYHVKDLKAGPLLDQAVLRALGATHEQECPEGVPDHVRERWPAEGAMVLTDDDGNQMFYGMKNIPQFSSEFGVGGPILERERIMTMPAAACGEPPLWLAGIGQMAHPYCGDPVPDGSDAEERIVGPTMLVAGCRVLVLAKLGPTIELFDPFAKFGTASAVQGPPR